MSASVTVLAHQGGWDEIAMVAGPLLVFAGVLYLANRRATQKLAASAAVADDEFAADHHVTDDLVD